MGQVFFAQSAIRDLFSQKGFLDATVDVEVGEITTTSRSLEFTMLPGGKTRIRSINFTGNKIFKDKKLKKMLRLTQERKWFWPWSSKNLYHPVKWDQDVSRVREAYQNRGYLDVDTHAPIVEVRRKSQKQEEKFREQQQAAAAAVEEPPPPPPPVDDPSLTPKQKKKLEQKREKQERLCRSSRAARCPRTAPIGLPHILHCTLHRG